MMNHNNLFKTRFTEKKILILKSRIIISNENKEFFSNSNFKELISLFDNLDSKMKIFFIAGDVGVLKEKTVLFCEKKTKMVLSCRV